MVVKLLFSKCFQKLCCVRFYSSCSRTTELLSIRQSGVRNNFDDSSRELTLRYLVPVQRQVYTLTCV